MPLNSYTSPFASYASPLSQFGAPAPLSEGERVQHEVENLLKRLQATGVAPPKPAPWARPLATIGDILGRLGSASMLALQEFTPMEQQGETPGVFDPLQAFLRGIRKEEELTGKELVRRAGVSEKPWFEANIGPVTIAPSAAGLTGFAAEVLNPFDPLNWLTFGLGKLAKPALKGVPLLEKAFGSEGAETLTRILGDKAVEKITAPNAADLVKLIGLKLKGKDEAAETVAKLVTLMNQRGIKPATQFEPIARYITAGLQLPGVNKTLATFNVPGSQYLTEGLGRLGQALSKTPLGQALGERFSTTFATDRMPSMVWSRLSQVLREEGNTGAAEAIEKAFPVQEVAGLTTGAATVGEAAQKMVPLSAKDAMKKLMQFMRKMQNPTAEEEFKRQVAKVFQGLNQESRTKILRAIFDPSILETMHGQELDAFNFFQNQMKLIREQYEKMGVHFLPIEEYFPFILERVPSREEMTILTTMFGTGVHKLRSEDELLSIASVIDPNLRKRTTQALNPEEINKYFSRSLFVTDPETALVRRGIRAIRGQKALEAIDKIKDFSLIVDNVKDLKELPAGYVLTQPVVHTSGAVMLEAIPEKALIEGTASKKALLIPEEIARIYNDYADLLFNPGAKSNLLKLFDQVTRAYRTISYMWNPGHIPRDFLSNIYNLWLGDVRSPEPYLLSLQALTNPKGALRIGGQELTGETLLKMANEQGLVDTGAVLGEFLQAGKDWSFFRTGPLGKYTEAMRTITRSGDNLSRLAGFIDRLNKGDTVGQAASFVKKFLFDYADLTPFEQRWMRRIVPFYTFMRKNMPLQIEMLLRKPGKMATTYKALRGIGEMPKEGEAPAFVTEALGTQLAGPEGGIFMMTDLPYEDISRLPTSLENTRQLLSAVNPLIRMPVEMLTNTSFYSGIPLENYRGEQEKIPLASLIEALGLPAPVVPKRTVGYALNQVSPLRNLSVILNPQHPRQAARILSILGGPQIYPVKWGKQSAAYEQRDVLRDFIRYLQDKGIETPTIRELEKAGLLE